MKPLLAILITVAATSISSAQAPVPAAVLWQELPARGTYAQAVHQMRMLPTIEKHPNELIAIWRGEKGGRYVVKLDPNSRPYRYVKK